MSISPARIHGIQPIQNIIEADGRTIRGFVRLLRTKQSHALLAIAGRVPPSPELRAELTAKLGLPLDMLFTKSALESEYRSKGSVGAMTLGR